MKHLLWILPALLFTFAGCHRKPATGPKAETDTVPVAAQTVAAATPTMSTPQRLLETYRSGEIEECKDPSGNTVYRCQRNIRDIETRIYDAAANEIGSCYYSMSELDEICKQTTECRTLYRVEKNIWGKPAVNLIEQ